MVTNGGWWWSVVGGEVVKVRRETESERAVEQKKVVVGWLSPTKRETWRVRGVAEDEDEE